ncbi:hypothetical protein [Marinococcus halotolerans]|nr:hypothetical protein [Marinococcus halotolerans]
MNKHHLLNQLNALKQQWAQKEISLREYLQQRLNLRQQLNKKHDEK